MVMRRNSDNPDMSDVMERGYGLLSIADVAELLAVPVSTVYQWRSRGEGPLGFRIGKHVRFRPEDIEAWLEERRE